MKALVAYFSATGNTKALAEKMAEAAGADLFEIVPEIPYTAADLDWQDSQSRSSLEMENKASRPGIRDKAGNMDEYDVIFVGFPIWWYTAPRIINTFLEQYDLTGRTVIPFATSGSSGMGSTNAYLAPSCKGARLLAGRRFSGRATKQDLKRWVASLNLG
ncbi:MAG: NAD(P)H-dependent oxidoreductase [Clostridia bacterium]|nr:NAD(P)H-dependent oxidoreductase [Clostridia bacterium]